MMMERKRRGGAVGINALLHGDQVRRVLRDGKTFYAAVDVVALLTDPQHGPEVWTELKLQEPQLLQHIVPVAFPAIDGRLETDEGIEVEGLLRLIQSIPSPRAERLKQWLARSARQRLQESDDPELLALRARKLYEHKGYSRRWVDRRLRGISTRQELTGEWRKRGATDSEQYRSLTNHLMHSAFGMDAEGYRRYKHLTTANPNLRDHMSDLELALTSLGETVAVSLHHARDSHGLEQLQSDAKDAGEIVALTRREIERRGGRSVTTSGNHLPERRDPDRRSSDTELANKAEDMHNLSTRTPLRTVA